MSGGEIRNFLGGWGWLGHYFGYVGMGEKLSWVGRSGWECMGNYFGWVGIGGKMFWVGTG